MSSQTNTKHKVTVRRLAEMKQAKKKKKKKKSSV